MPRTFEDYTRTPLSHHLPNQANSRSSAYYTLHEKEPSGMKDREHIWVDLGGFRKLTMKLT